MGLRVREGVCAEARLQLVERAIAFASEQALHAFAQHAQVLRPVLEEGGDDLDRACARDDRPDHIDAGVHAAGDRQVGALQRSGENLREAQPQRQLRGVGQPHRGGGRTAPGTGERLIEAVEENEGIRTCAV